MSALDEIVYNAIRLHDRSSVVHLQRMHLTGWISAASSAHLKFILCGILIWYEFALLERIVVFGWSLIFFSTKQEGGKRSQRKKIE